MHGLVGPQTFDVRPVENLCLLSGHPGRIDESLEGYILGDLPAARPAQEAWPAESPTQGMTIDHPSTQRIR